MNVTGPVFDYKGKEYTVQSSKECRIWLLDTRELGGEDHRTPVLPDAARLQRGSAVRRRRHLGRALDLGRHERHALGPDAVLGAEALAVQAPRSSTARSCTGRSPRSRSEIRDGKPQLAPAWLSRDMNHAEPAVIANGVVFGYGSGEDATQATADIGLAYNTAANRVAHSTHAMLYALDAQTGDELWSSGDQITSFNHFTQSVGRERPRLHRHLRRQAVRASASIGQPARSDRGEEMTRVIRGAGSVRDWSWPRRLGAQGGRANGRRPPRRAADRLGANRRAAHEGGASRRGVFEFLWKATIRERQSPVELVDASPSSSIA